MNKAVSEMDEVVQQNAANAEELASASEESSAQAGRMKDIVCALIRLVDGGNGNGDVGGQSLALTAGRKSRAGRDLFASMKIHTRAIDKKASKSRNGDGSLTPKPEKPVPFGDEAGRSDF